MSPVPAPCGTWKSRFSTADVARGAKKFSDIRGDASQVYWIEMRPEENGRCVIMRYDQQAGVRECLPQPFSARTRAYEYGGGAYTVASGEIYFSHDLDQRIYHTNNLVRPFPVSEANLFRYADLVIDEERRRLIGVGEDYSRLDVVHSLVAIGVDESRDVITLAQGKDFYASPRLSLDGGQLAWIAWDHPHMPWDTTELWVADINHDGTLDNARRVAGGAHESIMQPLWRENGSLLFVSDRSGWWNLFVYQRGSVKPVFVQQAEFAAAPWVLGMSSYGVTSDGNIACSWNSDGIWHLELIDHRGKCRELPLSLTDISSVSVQNTSVAFVGAGSAQPAGVYNWDLKTDRVQAIRLAANTPLASDSISRAQLYEVPVRERITSQVFFYAPVNPAYQIPETERPPLIINVHGGPTASASPALNEQTQYWTSRGFAVADINYRGSTGYGRDYRDQLQGQWGVIDVEDCRVTAAFLADQGVVDRKRIIIRGRSAGGFTVLNALRQSDVFCAGTVYYGVSDLQQLAAQTHKFESRYVDWLIGLFPQHRQAYEERSPLYHSREILRPILFFQGQDDRIVPPEQTEQIVARLKSQGVPVEYLKFSGESHGFRRMETLSRCLQAEWYFYCHIFGLPIPEELNAASLPDHF